MSYRNAKEVLPVALLEELQRYAGGSCLYIPRREGERQTWGAATETKRILQERNCQIQRDYRHCTVKELAAKYYLSEKTIRKILKQNG